MRTNVTTGLGSLKLWYTHPEYGDVHYARDQYEYELSKLVRSEISRTVAGPDGFRSPTPYIADFLYKSPCNIGDSYDYPYYGRKYKRDITYFMPVAISSTVLERLMPSVSDVGHCETEALNNVANRKGSFAESAAEVISTAQGLSRNATSIRRFIEAAIRRDKKGVARALGFSQRNRKIRRAELKWVEGGSTLGGAWLNYWFGLAPIVSDMVSIASFLSSEDVHRKLRVKGTAQLISNESKTDWSHTEALHAFLPCHIRGQSKQYSFTRVSLDFSITSRSLRDLAVYGATDVPATLWAITPWSFLIDWVLPVSKLLKAYTADSFLDFRGGTLTKAAVVSYKDTSFTFDAWDHISNHDKNVHLGFQEGRRLRRTVYLRPPIPMTIKLKDPFSLWTGITSMSLLAAKMEFFNPKK